MKIKYKNGSSEMVSKKYLKSSDYIERIKSACKVVKSVSLCTFEMKNVGQRITDNACEKLCI